MLVNVKLGIISYSIYICAGFKLDFVFNLLQVLLLVSGGVDSTVCAALFHKALRQDQVIAIHIDNGFMRKNESAKVQDSLLKLGLDLKVIKAAATFSEGTTVVPIDKEGKFLNGLFTLSYE